MTLEQLRELQAFNIQKELDSRGGSLFLGFPDRWFDNFTVRCVNGHVSHHVVKSVLAGDMCTECTGPCVLTFPEDADD